MQLIMGMLFCLFWFAPRAGYAESRKKVKLIVFAVDGLSPDLLEALMRRNAVPHMRSLSEDGVRGILKSFWPMRTMQVWTSMATGKLPGQHGIWDHVAHSDYNPPEFRTNFRKVYTPDDRKSKALWNLLSEKNLKTLVIGWPTTWPAERIENAVIVAPKVLYGDGRNVTIKGSFWRRTENIVHPEIFQKEVQKWIVEPGDIKNPELYSWAGIPEDPADLYQTPKIKDYVYALRWNLARAGSVEKLTLNLSLRACPDVILSYFQCSDSLLHRFWIFQKTEEEIRARLAQFHIPTDKAGLLKRHFGKVVENCYRDVDRRIGRILDRLRSDGTLVMVVSDHGFGDGPKLHPFRAEPYGGIHHTNGVMIAAGPGICSDAKLDNASVLDVTPTILYALQLPVAQDMRGRVLWELFSETVRKNRPIDTISSYESKAQIICPYAEGYPPKPEDFIW